MPDTAFKKIGTAGNCKVVVIPAVMLAKLHWLKGDWLELTLDDVAGTITMRATKRAGAADAQPTRVREALEGAR